MKRNKESQGAVFIYTSPEQMVPANHPLRTIKGFADEILKSMASALNAMYAKHGRPSIPPESLLKA